MTPSPMTTGNVKRNFFKGKTEEEMEGEGIKEERGGEEDIENKEEEKKLHTLVAMLHDL